MKILSKLFGSKEEIENPPLVIKGRLNILTDLVRVNGSVPIFAIKNHKTPPTPKDVEYMFEAAHVQLSADFEQQPINLVTYTFDQIRDMANQMGLDHHTSINNLTFQMLAVNFVVAFMKEQKLNLNGRTITLQNGQNVEMVHLWAGKLPDSHNGWLVVLVNASTIAVK